MANKWCVIFYECYETWMTCYSTLRQAKAEALDHAQKTGSGCPIVRYIEHVDAPRPEPIEPLPPEERVGLEEMQRRWAEAFHKVDSAVYKAGVMPRGLERISTLMKKLHEDRKTS